MTSEVEKKSGKKKKKARKDKWGQPVLSPAEEEPQEYGSHDGGGGEDDRTTAEKQTSYEGNKVVVSGMPYSATEDEIRDLFKDIGPIHHLQLSRFPDSGNFRGLAFVTFQTEANATSSLKLDGTKMGNRFLKIERCRLDTQRKRKSEFLNDPKKVEGCFSAYIGNLSWEVTEDDVRDFFETSNIVSVRFAFDKTGVFRGFGHIDFADDESLEKAMEKNQVELQGRPMKIAYAVCDKN